MSRKKAQDRLGDIVETAANILIHKGYRRTQMADITAALGLSPGAIYRYVESKEALFDLVVRATALDDFASDKLSLPVASPASGATLAFVRQAIEGVAGSPALQRALDCDEPSDIAAEFTAIVRELFAPIARYHRGLRILERSALEWPELSELWWGGLRRAAIDSLTLYIAKRTEQGYLHRFPNAEAASRLLTEVCAYYAMHRHYDPNPTAMSDETAQTVALEALLRAFVKE